MAKTPLFAGNWKMHKTEEEARRLAAEVRAGLAAAAGGEVLLCPPFTALAAVREVLAGSSLKLGAQNAFYEPQGAFTGEVSAPMLAAAGCQYVICGHSERRQYFGETDEIVNRKVLAVLGAGLHPILCVGETLAEREAGEGWKDVVRRQVTGGVAGVGQDQASLLTVAYEPVWAIGTGKTATPEQAAEAHAVIRERLEALYGADVASGARILYGGSVKPGNIADLMGQPGVDGALVGGASLKAEEFIAIAGWRP